MVLPSLAVTRSTDVSSWACRDTRAGKRQATVRTTIGLIREVFMLRCSVVHTVALPGVEGTVNRYYWFVNGLSGRVRQHVAHEHQQSFRREGLLQEFDRAIAAHICGLGIYEHAAD